MSKSSMAEVQSDKIVDEKYLSMVDNGPLAFPVVLVKDKRRCEQREIVL